MLIIPTDVHSSAIKDKRRGGVSVECLLFFYILTRRVAQNRERYSSELKNALTISAETKLPPNWSSFESQKL
jgi:hypothetical protein